MVTALPEPTTVGAGLPAKFVLELATVDNLTVQWFKGSEKIDKSDRIKSVKSGKAFKLDFKVRGRFNNRMKIAVHIDRFNFLLRLKTVIGRERAVV